MDNKKPAGKKISSAGEVFLGLKSQKKKNWPLPLICIPIAENWKQLAGPKWAEESSPVSFKNHCLFVRVPSSCHIQEISFEKEAILARVNNFIGSEKVRDIRWIL